MSKTEYLQINRDDLPDVFEVRKDQVYLKNSSARPISIKFSLVLDENIAKIPGMIMDGYLSKELVSAGFCQKKDTSKILEVNNIIYDRFGIKGRFSIQNKSEAHTLNYSKTFTRFLYLCLDIHKSNESARIPTWVWKSPKSVIVEYLRYAYAMEGSVHDPRKGSEIRFHSCDLPYLFDLKKLLEEKFGISSRIQGYYVNGYGEKYYLQFAKMSEVKKFYENIGFAIEPHQSRLKQIVENTLPKAWEVTLVKLLELKQPFRVKQATALFSYLTFETLCHRFRDLVKMNYLTKNQEGYIFTELGLNQANSLKHQVRLVSVRTNPTENEEQVLQFIKQKGKTFRSEIMRELRINPSTVRDVLKRLIKQHKITLTNVDKFQRRFYVLIDKSKA